MPETKVTNQTRPAVSGLSVTGTVTFEHLTRAVYVGTAGDLPVTFSDGSTVTLTNVQNGYHPLELQAIDGTGLTAGGVVALF
jgi:hypothetical protein